MYNQPSTYTQTIHLYHTLNIQNKNIIQKYFYTKNINKNQLQYKHIPKFLSINQSIKKLSHLKHIYTTKLIHNLKKKNIFKTFKLTNTYKLQKISKKYTNKIIKYINNIKNTNQFLTLKNSQIKKIIQNKNNKKKLLIKNTINK